VRTGRLSACAALFALLAGCAGWFWEDRATRIYPRPARETLVAVNLALRDLNFFPTDVVPSHSNPTLTYLSTAYLEASLGEIVYVAVRDLGDDRSQVEVLTHGDVTGSWTWSTWWPPIIFEQTSRRLFAATSPARPLVPPPPPGRPPTN
jgi:hypothetical protein